MIDKFFEYAEENRFVKTQQNLDNGLDPEKIIFGDKISSELAEYLTPLISAISQAYVLERRFGDTIQQSVLAALIIASCDNFDHVFKTIKNTKEKIQQTRKEFELTQKNKTVI